MTTTQNICGLIEEQRRIIALARVGSSPSERIDFMRNRKISDPESIAPMRHGVYVQHNSVTAIYATDAQSFPVIDLMQDNTVLGIIDEKIKSTYLFGISPNPNTLDRCIASEVHINFSQGAAITDFPKYMNKENYENNYKYIFTKLFKAASNTAGIQIPLILDTLALRDYVKEYRRSNIKSRKKDMIIHYFDLSHNFGGVDFVHIT